MSKADEIGMLRAFVASLPPGSYLGPWLLSVLPEIEADMKGDIFPSVTPEDTRKRCDAIEKQAAEVAARVIEKGKREAAALVAAADQAGREKVARVRERCASLVRAIRSVSSAADAVLSADSKLEIA
jgi:hypothetical protein